MKDIPVHQWQHRTSPGMELRYFKPGDVAEKDETLSAHRDDHYLFFT